MRPLIPSFGLCEVSVGQGACPFPTSERTGALPKPSSAAQAISVSFRLHAPSRAHNDP
jgi:hypothetical protein